MSRWQRVEEKLIWTAGMVNLMVFPSGGCAYSWRMYLVGVNGALDDPMKLLDLGHAHTERGAQRKASQAALKHLRETCKLLGIKWDLGRRRKR